ncbi:formyltetrahydrofolate deformylase [Verrucomicrobium sp. BvORR034]|jgi:formyltetrahydrofolate deformylase|uniref:formyltetrahydrofolate deformylase n=1 Tax=Verrucomicrobium sp. BvORR034 TaxID=1396418 RepID=UPI0006784BD8|nr:formyltetrahydrofolate deformylase [Verrucomicrobium sp. BvORR034]
MSSSDTATLLIHCPDQPGLVHAVTGFIFAHQGNILDLEQHIDPPENLFFMRVEWAVENFTLAKDDIAAAFAPLGEKYRMGWTLHFSSERKRVALFVSKESHCLYDLLSRHEAGELPVEIPVVVSNHEHLRPAAERFGIPFHCFPMSPATKAVQERAQIDLLREHAVDTVVLARYMQILSEDLIREFPNQILNIHHSFLPAFVGAKPYHQAYERGVKIIGATSHYVTAALDEGPIIHQDVMRVTHEDSVADLVRLGKDLEKTVLSKALWWHVRDKVLVYHNKTVVFS